MLKYIETNWQSDEGLQTRSYQVTFYEVKSQSTIEEQKERAERLSLVNFINDSKRRQLSDICGQFQNNFEHFYFDKNKKFHTTLLGFPVVKPKYYDEITERINQFSLREQAEMSVRFDLVRLGTKYQNNNTLNPIQGVSNGTVIAFGDWIRNSRFTTFGNNLASFLFDDEDLKRALGWKFRRRFPTVWCTMGYYTADFNITTNLEALFNKFQNLDSDFFHVPCYEVELGTSHYKDLRDWKRIRRFSLPTS